MHAGRTITAMDAIEEAESEKPARRGWDFSWNRWPNRLGYSIAAGFVVNLAADTRTLGTVIAVVLFVLTSAVVEVGRRR